MKPCHEIVKRLQFIAKKKSAVSRHPKIFNLKSNTMKKHSAKSVIIHI